MPINPDLICRADIVLVRTQRSFVSWLIRKFTNSKYNHVALIISKDNQWPKFTIEALGRGVVSLPFELAYMKVLRDDDGKIIESKPNKKVKIAIARVNGLSKKQRKKIAGIAYRWAYEGKGYDFLLLTVGMIAHLVTAKRWRPKWLNRSKAFICSELVAEAYLKGANISFGKKGFVSPADIGHQVVLRENMSIIAES